MSLEEVWGNSRAMKCIIVYVGQGHIAADPEESHCGKSTAGKKRGGNGDWKEIDVTQKVITYPSVRGYVLFLALPWGIES